MNGVPGVFDQVDVWFAEKPNASEDQWQVDGSIVRRNGGVFVDLQEVDHIGLYHFAGSGGTVKRLTLHTPNGPLDIAIRTRFSREGEYAYDALQRTLLIRFGHYRPDAMVNPNDDDGMKFAWLFGAVAMGGMCAYLLYAVFSGVGFDGQAATTSPFVLVGFALMCLIIATLFLVRFTRKPKSSTFYAASPPSGLNRRHDRIDKIVAVCVALAGTGFLVFSILRFFVFT